MLELITGAIVACAALALVLEPLLRRLPSDPIHPDWEPVELEESESPKVRALLALREIEFDRATGKLSDADYARLKGRYGRLALDAIDAELSDARSHGADAAEDAVAKMRGQGRAACIACGDRPEPTAIFCSQCGRSLTDRDARPRCWMCGDPLEADARFCGSCGFALSA